MRRLSLGSLLLAVVGSLLLGVAWKLSHDRARLLDGGPSGAGGWPDRSRYVCAWRSPNGCEESIRLWRVTRDGQNAVAEFEREILLPPVLAIRPGVSCVWLSPAGTRALVRASASTWLRVDLQSTAPPVAIHCDIDQPSLLPGPYDVFYRGSKLFVVGSEGGMLRQARFEEPITNVFPAEEPTCCWVALGDRIVKWDLKQGREAAAFPARHVQAVRERGGTLVVACDEPSELHVLTPKPRTIPINYVHGFYAKSLFLDTSGELTLACFGSVRGDFYVRYRRGDERFYAQRGLEPATEGHRIEHQHRLMATTIDNLPVFVDLLDGSVELRAIPFGHAVSLAETYAWLGGTTAMCSWLLIGWICWHANRVRRRRSAKRRDSANACNG